MTVYCIFGTRVSTLYSGTVLVLDPDKWPIAVEL